MLNYFIIAGGKGLSPTRRRVLERAKSIMMRRLHSRTSSGPSADRHITKTVLSNLI